MIRFCRLAPVTVVAVLGFLLAVSGCAAVEPSLHVSPSDNSSMIVPAPKPWPRINEFSFSPENIVPGENVTLKWDVSDAIVVSIDSGVGKVKPSGSIRVSPQRTIKYTLTATGEKGVSTAWVAVIVPEKITLMPDLVITGITYNSGLLYYTIKNIGGADAGPSDTYLYDQSNMWRDTSWVDGLKAGEEKTRPFTNFDYRAEQVTICADGGKVVAEANKDNNCYISSFGFKYSYSFPQYASRAIWRGSAGRPEFGLTGDTSMGIVTKLNAVVAGDGKSYANVIEMVPVPDSYAWMEGVFGDWQESWQAAGYMLPLELPNNARFTALVGLSKEAVGSSGVTFLFGLMDASNAITWWPGITAGYDGKLQNIDIDLSKYAGKKVMAVLRVEAGAEADKDYALWIEPKISQ